VSSPNSPEFGCGTNFYQQAQTNTGLKLLGSTNESAQANVACFLQAFQQCVVPASISFVVNSGGAEAAHGGTTTRPRPLAVDNSGTTTGSRPSAVDSGAVPTVKEYDFDTESQSGGCAISKSVHLNMELQPKEAETCARVEQTGTDLSFVGCGNSGKITFPLDGPK
jgi:hypothetical protein